MKRLILRKRTDMKFLMIGRFPCLEDIVLHQKVLFKVYPEQLGEAVTYRDGSRGEKQEVQELGYDTGLVRQRG